MAFIQTAAVYITHRPSHVVRKGCALTQLTRTSVTSCTQLQPPLCSSCQRRLPNLPSVKLICILSMGLLHVCVFMLRMHTCQACCMGATLLALCCRSGHGAGRQGPVLQEQSPTSQTTSCTLPRC
jgi:hypothetical protein